MGSAATAPGRAGPRPLAAAGATAARPSPRRRPGPRRPSRRGGGPSWPSCRGRAQPRSDSAMAGYAVSRAAIGAGRARRPWPRVSVCSITTPSRHSGSMPGGRGTAASACAQPGRNAAVPPSRCATAPRQPPCGGRSFIRPARSTLSAGVCSTGSRLVRTTGRPAWSGRRRTGRPTGGAPPRRTSRRRPPSRAGGTARARSALAFAAARLLGRDDAVLDHAVQHPVPAGLAASGKRNGL